jgi:DNA topoisomerase-1
MFLGFRTFSFFKYLLAAAVLLSKSTSFWIYRKPLTPIISLAAKSKAVNDIDEWKNAAGKGPTLVIVESPSKAKTIQKFIDSDEYIIDYSAGHIRALAQAKDVPELKKLVVQEELKLNSADFGVNIFENFEPQYVHLEGKNEVIKRLKRLSTACSRILLASDEDREGEAISWHLVEVLKPKVPYKRAVFHEITEDAIRRSFENPRDIDMNRVHSQETRAILDRLTGYTVRVLIANDNKI